ncbi:MAG TPA: PAS domain S-box protein [Leptolyngbyaceae cyanobacterium]
MTEVKQTAFKANQKLLTGIPLLLTRYGVALVTVLLAVAVDFLLAPYLKATPTPPFFAAVMVSAWYGGLGPGLVATAFSTLAINYFFIEPFSSFHVPDVGTLVRLSVFLMTALLINSLNAAQQAAQRRAEANLRSLQLSEARFGSLAQSNIIGTIVADLDGSILKANDEFLQMVGYTREDLHAGRMRWREMTPPESIEASEQAVAALRTTGACSPFKKEYFRKDGTRISVLHGAVMTGENTVTGFVLDLSEHKQAQEKLQRTNETLQTLINACPVAIAFFDPQGIVRLWNRAAEQIFGWSAEEAIGQFMPTVPHRPQEFLQTIQTVLSGKALEHLEAQHLTKDSRWVDLEIWANLVHDEQGNPGCLGIALDVTERKRTQAALETSEERYRSLVSTATAVVWTTSPEGSFISPQPSWEAFTGQSWEEYAGWGWMEMVHPDDRERASAVCQEALAKRSVYEIEARLWHAASAQYRYMAARAVPLFNPDGSVREWIGANTDIHDRKQAEKDLQESEARFQVLVSNMPGMVYRYAPGIDSFPAFTYVSAGAYELVELEPEVILQDAAAFLNLIHPEDEPSFGCSVADAVKNSRPWQWEGRLTTPSGKMKWVQGRSRPESTEHGEVWDGLFLDITDRKQAEEALRRSETTLNALIASSPVGIALFDQNLRYIHVNEALAKINGISLSEHSGRTLWEILPHWAPLVAPVLQQVMQTREPLLNQEVVGATYPTDVVRYSLVNYFPVHLPNGDVLGVGVTSMDVTDRKRIEEALKQSEERLRVSQELSLDAFTILDCLRDATGAVVDFTWAYVNPKAAEIIQHPADELIGKRLLEVMPGHQLKGGLFERYIRVVETGEPHDIELYYDADGITSWFRNVAVKLEDGVAVFFSDISDRKRAEAEREQLLQREQAARQEAEAANRIKDEFLAVLSHELRSPLNPILGWAKLLRSHTLNEQQIAHGLEVIERNANLQTQLIEDLLDVSRILRGKLSLNTTPVNLATVISAALETASLAADAKSIQLRSFLNPDTLRVSGDAVRLQQIIWNLLSNAVKFTPEGGQVEIRLEQLGSQAQVTVSDTGQGISPDFLPHVFEHFRQADSSATRQFGGLGLGLAIVRHLTELHGGTVSVESSGEGQGATFRLKLPLMRKKTQPGNEPQLGLPPIDANTKILAGQHILVVDDEADTRDYLSFVLRQAGAIVTLVESAQEALQVLAHSSPSVIVSDIGMPKMDGYELMRQVRTTLTEQSHIPAIAITAYAGEADQRRALEAGFQQHIAKPVDPALLIRAVAALSTRSE